MKIYNLWYFTYTFYSERSYLSGQVFCRWSVLCERPFTHKGNVLVGIFTKMFIPLHPTAKLCYVPIVQHDVRELVGVQMSNGLPPCLSEINTSAFNILWSDGSRPTSRKNTKAVICVVNKNLSKYFCFISVEVHPLF